MKNSGFIFFLLSLVWCCSGCFEYEAQFEGPYMDGENIIDVELAKVVVYVAGGNVYLADKYARDSVIIDQSGSVTIASINNEHSKVLFKRADENIQIYDVEMAAVVDEVPETKTAIWFDYHANDETVYFLTSAGMLDTYGPEVLPSRPLNLRTLNSFFNSVSGAAVLQNGDVVYAGQAFQSLLVLTNGGNLIDYKEIYVDQKFMRTSRSEDVLWSSNGQGNSLILDRLPELTRISSNSSYKFGAPAEDGSYKVTENNRIETPSFLYVDSPGGQITAIDY